MIQGSTREENALAEGDRRDARRSADHTDLGPISTYVLTGFDPEAMAALSGATATVFTFILGYFIPDPLREE